MACKLFLETKGPKSQVILKLITQREMVKLKKNAKKLQQSVEYKEYVKRIEVAEKTYIKVKSERERWLNKQGYELDYRGRIRPDEDICPIPKKTMLELDNAHNLQMFGKRKDAQQIWDKVIKEYKLDEEFEG